MHHIHNTSESKFRQSIQDYSFVNVALVCGRTGWRLTNVTFISNFNNLIKNENLKKTLQHIFYLIDRMVVDELAERELFDFVKYLIDFSLVSDLSLEEVKSLETICVSNILSILGFFDEKFIQLSKENMGKIKNRKDLNLRLNKAIKESGL
jgi:hypothetical protein